MVIMEIKMIFYISLKEIRAFFRQKKEVFLFMVICMISVSFVMNYAFSFNRYRVNEMEREVERLASVYTIKSERMTACGEIDKLKSELKAKGLPEITETCLFARTSEGEEIVGSDFISRDSVALMEFWLESTDDILTGSGGNFCVVTERYFYSAHKDEGKYLKAVGEKLMIDNEEFEIKGVVEGFLLSGFLIDLTKFREKYSSCDKITFAFSETLSSEQEEEFYGVVKEHIEHGGIQPPEWPEQAVSSLQNTNIIYAAIIILAIVCLVLMLEFWQDCNKTTYAVYWLNGATKFKLVFSSVLGVIILALLSYFAGLGLGAAAQLIFPLMSKLALDDIILGFSLYMLCFIVSGAVISIKEMRSIGINDIRRDV